jgi:GTPase SAR1 family protein
MEVEFNEKVHYDGSSLDKYRIILFGDKEVGKTSLINRFINHTFREEYNPTTEIMYCIIK